MENKSYGSQLKIEKNIPIPERFNNLAVWKNTALAMEVGDSVVVKTESDRVNFRVACNRVGHKTASRKEGRVFRVWRVK